MKKTLKQFKEDMQIYGLITHRNVMINVYCKKKGDYVEEEDYETKEEFFEATKFNKQWVKNVEVFHLNTQTHIDILVGGN